MTNNICTVLLVSYNHAPYIRKAIESVLAQKTKYNFIINIFDDCSTDGTSDIIKEYAKQYPDKITVFIPEKNQGAQTNIWNAYKSVKTKYCALLECDDYWCDENKLEMQITALEKHPECSFCAHNTTIINLGENLRKTEHLQNIVVDKHFNKNLIVSLEDIDDIDYGYMNHVNSRLIRTSVYNLDEIKLKEAFLYDNCQFYYLLSKGDMYYINKVMSVYIETGKGVFSGCSIRKRFKIHLNALIDLNKETNEELTDLVYKDMSNLLNYYRGITKLLKHKDKVIKENHKFNIINKLQTIKRYFIPRFILDILDIPFNLIKFISRRLRNKQEETNNEIL